MGKRQNSGVSRRDFLKRGAAAGVGAAALGGLGQRLAAGEITFDRAADVVVIGAGTSGLAAAIQAVDHGVSVIVVEANYDIGGHGMLSGGNVVLGGGTSLQKKYNIQDSADQIYLDHTRPEHPTARYNDRDIIRAFADNSAATFEFLVANGVTFVEEAPTITEAGACTVARKQLTKVAGGGLKVSINGRPGSGLVRALEASARKKGAEFLLLHKMTGIVRETANSGRVLGITTTNEGKPVTIQARKAVVIATGGHSGNVDFRRMFDPRLTEEYQQVGDAYTLQNADGENAAMAIGAAMWGTANQTREAGLVISKTVHIGCRCGYSNLKWNPSSPVFQRAGASGLTVRNWQTAILVNQLGQRFWNEVDNSYDFLAACLGSAVLDGGRTRAGGPIWAIFDADAVKREHWDPKPPSVDINGYFFTGNTLAELAAAIVNKYQSRPISAAALEQTVARYNTFVEAGKDEDFGKPTPKYKIQTPPFYAAWSTPVLHDTLAGLRVNAEYQVIDRHAQVIPRLYCCGESASGFGMHGLAKCLVSGFIAGRGASTEA